MSLESAAESQTFLVKILKEIFRGFLWGKQIPKIGKQIPLLLGVGSVQKRGKGHLGLRG
jgi:hypothetical protein